jgi:hypothetical protein
LLRGSSNSSDDVSSKASISLLSTDYASFFLSLILNAVISWLATSSSNILYVVLSC